MRLMSSEENVRIEVNNNQVICTSCKGDKFLVDVYRVNCENGYSELHTTCHCCGKIEKYVYRTVRSKMIIKRTE